MQTLIVIIIVSLCVFYIGRRFYKNLKGGPPSCGCADGCSACNTRSDECDLPEKMDR